MEKVSTTTGKKRLKTRRKVVKRDVPLREKSDAYMSQGEKKREGKLPN